MSSYTCKECGSIVMRWGARCVACGSWDSIRASDPPAVMAKAPSPAGLTFPRSSALSERLASEDETPQPIAEPLVTTAAQPVRMIDVPEEKLARTSTGMASFDKVLGGGLVDASVILISGDPGAGKSTLINQVLAAIGRRVLYVTGEETVAQVTMRSRRVDAIHPELWIMPSCDIDDTLAHADKLRPAVLAIDSIQTMSDVTRGGEAGSALQVRACTLKLARYAKATDTIVIIICHVTKDGTFAGPNTLKHLVDVALKISVSEFGDRRILGVQGKNRFGNVIEIAAFAMTDKGMIAVDPTKSELATATEPDEPEPELDERDRDEADREGVGEPPQDAQDARDAEDLLGDGNGSVDDAIA